MKHLVQLTCAPQPIHKLLVAGALTLSGLLSLGTSAKASDADTQALKQARDRMLFGATLLQQRSYAFDGTTPFSMAFIGRGSYASIKTPLKAGVTYAILGVGDDDARDVDVIVQDDLGRSVAQDMDTNATAITSFSPRNSGNYTIFLKLHQSYDNASACSLSIFRNGGGYRLSNDSVRRTTDSMFEMAQECSDRFGTTFHHGVGQWAVVGSILKPGESSTFSGVATREGIYAFVAVGDEDMRDLDMKVRDVNRNLLIDDSDSSNVAVCAMQFDSRQTCSVELINAKSDDFSLVLHAALHR